MSSLPDILWFAHLRDGTTVLGCWVDRKVKAGDRITLVNSDEPGRWWTVESVDKNWRTVAQVGKGWHVGGL